MAESDNGGPAAVSAPLHREVKPARSRPLLLLPMAVGLGVLIWAFPLFHVVSLPGRTDAKAGAPADVTAFHPVAAAAKIWRTDLPAAAARAVEVKAVAGLLRADAGKARSQFAKASGLGTPYYFLRGRGQVVARERNVLRVAVEGAGSEIIALRVGPIFGNTVRDGCGLLDVNAFPGLQEFNALSAELNALVERNVLPVLRDKATVGATVAFAGCAEAPDAAPEEGEPLLTLVPLQVEVH